MKDTDLLTHEKFMRLALKQAELAYETGEVPVGAVLVYGNKVVAKAYNQTETLKDATAHAEMLAITAACHALQSKYVAGSTLYVTLEPCTMCAGAIKWAQINQVVFGAFDEKGGFERHTQPSLFPSKVQFIGGVLERECSKILIDFFKEMRGQ